MIAKEKNAVSPSQILELCLRLRSQFSERGVGLRQPEAEEVEARQKPDRGGQHERQHGERRHHGVRQDMCGT